MKTKQLDNKSITAIIKMNMYQQGIYIPDELFDKLGESAYSGYRTTSGIFMKIGGALSKKEFEELKSNKSSHNLAVKDISEMSYLDYLKNREWVTTQIFRESELVDVVTKTFFKLKVDNEGKFGIVGQFVNSNGEVMPVELDDVGIFMQGKYDDKEAVAVQAGGIRARASICGSNCISGCSFCSFGSGASKYKTGILTQERMDSYMGPLIDDVVLNKGVSQLFITGGNPSLEDMEAWTNVMEESIKRFKNAARMADISPNNLTIDVMLTPRSKDKYIATKEEYKAYLESLKDMRSNHGFS